MRRGAGAEVVVLEARDRIGGRTWTVPLGPGAIDLGGAWVHHPVGNPVAEALTAAGIGARNDGSYYSRMAVWADGWVDAPDATALTAAVGADEPVRADVLPAGRYVTFLHAGPYRSTTEPDLAAARARVQDWAEQHGIVWDHWDTGRGSAFRCYVEHYHVGPVEEPDYSKWETELAYLVSEG